MRKILLSCVVFLLAITLALTAAQAPAKNGTIRVVVMDTTKHTIPGVQLTLTNAKTEDVLKAQTDDTGEYRFNVPPGTYAVKAELTGFQVANVMNIKLGEDQTVRVDVTIKIGTMSNAILIGK